MFAGLYVSVIMTAHQLKFLARRYNVNTFATRTEVCLNGRLRDNNGGNGVYSRTTFVQWDTGPSNFRYDSRLAYVTGILENRNYIGTYDCCG